MPSSAGGILPGEHLRTTFSGLNANAREPQKYAGLMQWAPQLVTKSDPQASKPLAAAPEHRMVQLVSHVGRRGLTRGNKEREQALSGKGEKPQYHGLEDALTLDEQEHLIYMALYRDKVDQHQADLELGREPLSRSVVDKPPRRTIIGGRGDLTASEKPTAANPSAEDLLDQAAGVLSPSSRLKAQAAKNSGRREKENAPSHSASVSSRPRGGILAEFDETKRLGQLFDDYCRSKGSDDEIGEESPRLHNRARRLELGLLGKELTSNQDPAVRSARRQAPTSALPEGSASARAAGSEASSPQDFLAVSGTAEAPALGSDGHEDACSSRNPARSLDRRLMERVYKSITDRRIKLKAAAAADRALAGELSGQQEPATIEAFPTIHLTRMYRGRVEGMQRPHRSGAVVES